MKHTAHGYWLEEAGTVEPAPPLAGDRDADVVVVGGGYTGMWAAWHLKAARARGARRPARGRRALRAGPERSQRRLLQRDVALAAEHARALGRRGRAGGRPRRGRRGRRDRGLLRGARRSTPGSGAPATSRSPPPPPTTRPRPRRSPPAASWARPTRRVELSAEEVAERCCLAGLPRRRLLPRRGDRAAGAPGARPARAAARAPASRSASPRRCAGCGGARDCVEARTEGGRVRAARAVLATGGRREAAALARCAARLSIASSHIVLTEPVPELLEEIGWTGGECITDSRALVDYLRTTPDGRIAFGWGGGRIALGAGLEGRSELDREVVAQTVEHLGAFFPRSARADDHPRLGRADRRLADAPAAGHAAARRPRLRRRGLHRQRRRPLPHGRQDPRLAGARPPRRSLAPRLRRPLARRASRPSPSTGSAAKRSAPGSRPRRRPSWPAASPAAISSLLAKVPELIGFHIGR